MSIGQYDLWGVDLCVYDAGGEWKDLKKEFDVLVCLTVNLDANYLKTCVKVKLLIF